MPIIKGKLIKRISDDGLIDVQDHVPLGKEYFIDSDTIRTYTLMNARLNKIHKKQLGVDIIEDDLFPIELLEFEHERSLKQ